MPGVLGYQFMQHALAAAVLAGVACGVVGTYVVVRRMVFVSGGISHATFGGVGLALWLGFSPILGAVAFALAAAMGMGVVTRRTRLSEDAGIGVLWATGMALGVVFAGLAAGYTPDLFSYLFGNILTVLGSELRMMLVLDAVIVVTVLAFYKEFQAVSFDEEFSRVAGVPAGALQLVRLALIARTIVTVIRVVGIVLVIALITIPPSIARQFTASLRSMMLLAVVLAVALSICGIGLSYVLNVPSGATIVLLNGIVLAFVLLAKRLRGARPA